MTTVVLREPGRLEVLDSERPDSIGPGEALVRVLRVGVCGTDLHAFRGRQPFFSYPRILGHELGVEVLEAGENDSGIQRGDRCAVEPYLSCGQCGACRKGKTNCCVDLKVLGVHVDGGMREVIRVPIRNLHPSASLTTDQLALVETLGIGAHAVDRAGLQRGEWALVIGAGPIGLAVAQFACLAGARVIIMDVNEDRLEGCRSLLPIDATVPARPDSLAQVEAFTGEDLAQVVFDATGSPESMMASFQYAGHGGRIVFVGIVLADITFHDPDLHRKELTLLATRNSTALDFRRIIDLMESGQIDTTAWITYRCPAESVVSTFPDWLDPRNRVLKAVIEF